MLATEILTQDYRNAMSLIEQLGRPRIEALGEEIESLKEEGGMSHSMRM